MFRKPAAGMTYLELLVVLLIIVLITAIALPAVTNSIAVYNLKGAALALAGDIRLAQQAAITTGNAGYLRFYASGNYRLVLPDKERYVQLPQGVSVTANNFNTELYFLRSGAPSQGGTVVLENNRGEKLYVIVTPVTGRVRVSKTPPLA